MSSTRPAALASRVVCVPSVELLSRPDHRSECLTECVMGSRLIVLAKRQADRWLHVTAPDGYKAWVCGWATCEATTRYEDGRGVFVTTPHASLRSRPSRIAAPVALLGMGCGLSLTGRRHAGVLEAVTPDGRVGWIDATSLEPDDVPALAGFWDAPLQSPRFGASRVRVRGRAQALLGLPYRWGGASASGLDCSGFVRLVLGLEGTVLPRNARDQERAVRERRVDRDPAHLRSGELVFFGPRRGAATHVALGIGGRAGRFIHASGSVRIGGLDPKDPLYDADLARRVRGIARF
jgi:gamma-D-glutamyl-L-lysine dipeptidyl-peptidase